MQPEWFAGRLKELREAKGWTQRQLAEAAGLAVAGVQNLEQGRTYPEWPTVLALCQALGVSCDAFAVEPSTPSPVAGRGRPRKPTAESVDQQQPKRPRGRPRKDTETPGAAQETPSG